MEEKNCREWKLIRIGNASGSIAIDGREYLLNSETQEFTCGTLQSENSVSFCSKKGKLGDSEDSFLFCCARILTKKENFQLSAVFTVTEASKPRSWQDGYGIFAADTIMSASQFARYRNLLSVGRHRMNNAQICSAGLRVAAGHTDTTAMGDDSGRCLDTSRAFRKLMLPACLQAGEKLQITLRKNDYGFYATIRTDTANQSSFFPGCSFLEIQEKGALYVGFGAAGNFCLEVSQIHFSVSPGHSSYTPYFALRNRPPEYPFSRSLRLKKLCRFYWKLPPAIAVASPDGQSTGKGTRQSPMDLTTAIASGAHEILLMDGVYNIKQPILLTNTLYGTGRYLHADHTGAAILDGTCITDVAPLVILRGSGWVVEGVAFEHSPSAGLHICGNDNLILRCRASENADTGILVCAWPGSPRQRWPKNNSIEQCESFYNCDTASGNADGFGAKLSVGEGNRFSDCLAHHNIDDGFDLYSKLTLGPIGPVTLENCAAFYNGRLSSDSELGDGSGFKLGGEGIPVPHEVHCCAAYGNVKSGFFLNSNPAPQLKHLIAGGNGMDGHQNYRLNTRTESGTYVLTLDDLQEISSSDPRSLSDAPDELPERDNNGRLLLERHFTQHDKRQVW